MLEGNLSRGEVFFLKSDHVYPLAGSAQEGALSAARTLEVKAGTKAVVAKDCGRDEPEVQVYFIDETLNGYGQGKGPPFFAHRIFLEGDSARPARGEGRSDH